MLITAAANRVNAYLFGVAGGVARHVVDSVKSNAADPRIGVFGLLGVFLYAYSMGAGTYTSIEAVSNSMPVMREPRVATAKRTMVYMALSLTFTAGGLMVAYLLLGIEPSANKTMNQILTEIFVNEIGLTSFGLGSIFFWVTCRRGRGLRSKLAAGDSRSHGALTFSRASAGLLTGALSSS